jgi:hypothetical protein
MSSEGGRPGCVAPSRARAWCSPDAWRPRGTDVLKAVGHDASAFGFLIDLDAVSCTTCQANFEDLILSIQVDLVRAIVRKIIEGHEVYKIFNWSLSWFCRVCELQALKEVYTKTVRSSND